MAKGAGMIGPRMATMLAVVLTDAKLTVDAAQESLAAAAERSFNCISVEGHTSTNDTALLVASNDAAGPLLTGAALKTFQESLQQVCVELARQIPDDGEGATHLISIEVDGCATREDARRIAKTVAESALVKTAIAGGDPNWGRIVSAAGYAGVPFRPESLRLSINGTVLYRNGSPATFDEAAVSRSIRNNRETRIALHLDAGPAAVTFWTSDLTVDYVRFNAEYHT
jgi:glutamate N-acetyltransferase/amino-acid N-acetyltransferase